MAYDSCADSSGFYTREGGLGGGHKRFKVAPNRTSRVIGRGSRAAPSRAAGGLRFSMFNTNRGVSVLIAVACFLVIYFWGEPIVIE